MHRARAITLSFAALTAIYLYAFPSATIPYLAIVLGHVAAGFVLSVLLLLSRPRSAGWIATAGGALLGIALTWTGASRPFAPLLYAHIGTSALGVIVLLSTGMRRPIVGFAALFAAVLALG